MEFLIEGDVILAASRILMPVALATVLPSAQILPATTPAFASANGTVAATQGGTLYGVVAANTGTQGATLLLYSPLWGGNPFIVVAPAADTRGWVNTRGVVYSAPLSATILGALRVTLM